MAKRKKKRENPKQPQNEAPLPQTSAPTKVDPSPIEAGEREYLVREWEFFSGPLPPPDVFARYKEIDPQVAQVILDLTVKEQEHRHQEERKLTEADIRSHFRGQGFAALISILLIGSMTFLFATDHTWEAAGLGAGGFASVILAFLRNRFLEQPPERPSKDMIQKSSGVEKKEGGEAR